MYLKAKQIDLEKRTIFRYLTFQPPLRKSFAMNDEACFIFAIDGHSNLYSSQGQEEIQSGEGILMKCGHYIKNWSKLGDKRSSEVIVVHLYPDVLKAIYETSLPDYLNPNQPVYKGVGAAKIKADKVLQSFIDSLLFYFQNPSLVCDQLVRLKIKELILLLVNTGDKNIQELLINLFHPEEYTIKQVVDSHLFEDLSIEELADLSYMSPSTFKRKFKQLIGESPGRYIKQKRMEKAAELLKISSENITQISFACGYKDPGHFSKAFRNFYGYSPKKFREKAISTT